MNQVNVDSDQVLRLATALKVFADRTSEIMNTMHRIYTHLDYEWDDESKHEFIDFQGKTGLQKMLLANTHLFRNFHK